MLPLPSNSMPSNAEYPEGSATGSPAVPSSLIGILSTMGSPSVTA